MRSTPTKLGVTSTQPTEDELRRSAADHPVFRLERP